MQQNHLEIELYVKDFETTTSPAPAHYTPLTAWFGGFCCWRRQAGGTTGSRRNHDNPVWSVAEENQASGGVFRDWATMATRG